ncbi:hypothetical protein [Pseudoteredinibacter isoporae]|uniref:hypothetical protein n=1 Tax=Pseudoteredinibacter isoporae TaxID=570281 RepID=UPI0031068805
MKKLGLYVALALFVPSVMAKEVAVSNIAVAIAEAGANYSWAVEKMTTSTTESKLLELEAQHEELTNKLNAKLERKMTVKAERQFQLPPKQ